MSLKDMRWETNFKVDIPKFHGGISSDSFLDWLVDVENFLEFQSVTEDQLVSLVVKKFRGQAASWWQQVKTTRKRAGKKPIKSWDKLKQKLCATFLPRNYDSLLSTHLKNLEQRVRFVDDYVEDCFVKVKEVIDEPLYDVDDDNLSTMKLASNGDSILDIKDNKDGDVVDVEDNDDVEAKKDDVLDLENDDVIVYVENDDDFVNTNVNDEDSTLANKINDSNVFAAIFEDCDSVVNHTFSQGQSKESISTDLHDDPSDQDEASSFDVTKVGDLVDNVNPIVVFSDGFSPVHVDCSEDVNNIDIIRNQVVEYSRLSTIKYELVITNLDKEEEDSYMDKENHNYSIYLAQRHQKINGEPPDRGRSVILFFHGEVDLYNKISGTLVSNIYEGENHCYNDLYGEIQEGDLEFAKSLVFFRHCGSTREDFHGGYMSNQQDERIYMCSSTTVIMNWDLGHEKPMKIQSCHQRDVYDEDVDIIIPIIYFITNGAVNTNKWDLMNFGVEYSMMMMLFSREMKDVSYAVTNTMDFLLNVYKAITTVTCEGRRIFLLLFDIRELKSKDTFAYQLTLHEQITVLASNKESREHPLTQISMDLGKVTLVEDRTPCLETFARRLAFPFGSFMVYLFDASLRTKWKRRVVCISYLGNSVRTTAGLTWENELLCRNENDIGKLFKDQTSSEAHLLFVVDSFKILIANDVLEVHILHHQKFIDVKSTITWVLVVFRHHAFPPVLFVPIISFTIELHCRAFTRIICVLPHPLLGSIYTSTTRIRWSNGACESRKLFTCGKLSLVLACFSTNVRFLVGKETSNAFVVVLMWKLLDLSLDMNSSYRTPAKVLVREFMNMVRCLLGANLTRGDTKYWQAKFANLYISNHNLVFRPFQVIYGLYPRGMLDFLTVRYMMRCHGESFDFAIACQDVLQKIQQYLKLAATTFISSMVKRFYMVFDPGDFEWVVFTKACFPLHTRSDSDNVQEVILKTEFEICYEQWYKINQENIDHVKDKLLLQHKMERLEKKLVSEKEESKRLKIKLAATQGCFCALKREDHNVLIIRLKAALVAEKEKSNQLEKELMEYKRNVRMLNSGTKNLDQILSMGRLGKARCGLGYRGDISSSKTVFVPGSLSMSTGIREQPDSRPNPLPPDGT